MECQITGDEVATIAQLMVWQKAVLELMLEAVNTNDPVLLQGLVGVGLGHPCVVRDTVVADSVVDRIIAASGQPTTGPEHRLAVKENCRMQAAQMAARMGGAS